MNKRGQFYLVIALVLSLTIYGVTYRVNSIAEPKLWEDFNHVSTNYITESVIVANGALGRKGNVTEELRNFSYTFLEYAQKRNPELGLLYVYSDGDEISVRNYLDGAGQIGNQTVFGANQDLIQDVTVRIGGKEFIYKVPVTSENFGDDWTGMAMNNVPFNLSIAGIIHPFQLETDSPEFKVIIRSETGEYNTTYGEVGGEWDPLLSPNVQQLVT